MAIVCISPINLNIILKIINLSPLDFLVTSYITKDLLIFVVIDLPMDIILNLEHNDSWSY